MENRTIEELLDYVLAQIADKGTCDEFIDFPDTNKWMDDYIPKAESKGLKMGTPEFHIDSRKLRNKDRDLVNEIIQKLIVDGFIKQRGTHLPDTSVSYIVTVKGMTFKGYIKQKQKETWLHRRVKIESIAVICGGACAVLYYFLLPLLHHYHLMPKIWHLFDWLIFCGK